MDVVYPYRPAPGDLELRYSLRSLTNVEHERVIVAGEAPRTLCGFSVVTVPRQPSRYQSSALNIYEAARQEVQTERFVVMNDDIFVLSPWTFRHEHRATIEGFLGGGSPKGEYRRHLMETRAILKAHGVSDPLFFGLHTPTVYERGKLIELVNEFRGKRYLLRTLYHNLFPQPSALRSDVKVRRWDDEPETDVVSISDMVARDPRFLKWIDGRFPSPSPYEAENGEPQRAVA